MISIAAIVEGDGEVQAVPLLLRRLAHSLGSWEVECLRPAPLARAKIPREPDLKKHIELQARRTGPGGIIVILLDADDDCPANLGPKLTSWAYEQRPDRRFVVSVIPREFEAWFLASADSLRGQRGLSPMLSPPTKDPETIRDAKGWLSATMPRRYRPTLDQAPLAACFDLQAARSCPSFERFVQRFAAALQCDEVPDCLGKLRS